MSVTRLTPVNVLAAACASVQSGVAAARREARAGAPAGRGGWQTGMQTPAPTRSCSVGTSFICQAHDDADSFAKAAVVREGEDSQGTLWCVPGARVQGGSPCSSCYDASGSTTMHIFTGKSAHIVTTLS